ncbi:MAG: phosphate ABC transporter substrate-binding protein [Pseudanabaenaceae cyanobacterium SKYGB_i_bin29]|nr:phosphate ABC transporter substrate-binding protein [Pseudanabaenaceae cyanobacterium SKYG29]MDW8421694.1 phosphate ABC transporter substrate-binding protein [Pseudanabaenaceae cyanobacterium SKYGB_i_bin29]
MQQEKSHETIVLALSFLITLGVAGGLLWMFRGSFNFNKPADQTANAPAAPNPPVSLAPPPASTAAPSPPTLPVGTFNYGGSTTWAPIRALVDPEIARDYPQFRLRYLDPLDGSTPGSGTGIRMVIDRQLSFAQSSRSVKDEEQARAQARGFRLREVDVAIDGIVVAVNPNLAVEGITVEELRDIYLGKIRNWRQVGGPDLPITPYSRRPQDGGTVEFFQEYVLGKQNFGSNVEFVYSTTPALRKVSDNPGGIYYATAPEVVPQCSIKTLPLGRKKGNYVKPYAEPLVPPSRCPQERNSVNFAAFQSGDYPITRKLFVIMRDENSPDRQAADFYAEWLLTPKGQDLIAKAGYVPLR